MRSNIEDAILYNPLFMTALRHKPTVLTLGGTLTMGAQDSPVQLLDPGGATRIVLLPPEVEGAMYIIWNKADAAEDLTVKDDSNTTTYLTIAQNEAGILYSDGAAWHRMLLSAAAT